MGICLKITGLGNDNEKRIVYTSSDPCDGLALMLKNKTDNYRTKQKLDEILAPDEIQAIKCTYAENSMSVSEGYESFTPEYETPNRLQAILNKIKRFYIQKLLSDKTISEAQFNEILFDIATLSELYAALDIAGKQNLNVILTVEDF